MKRHILTVIFALILACSLFAITACTPSVQEIALDKNNMPQTVYVLGSELNLETGGLLADGVFVPFTDSKVSVSGYDKNTLGKQTLTVSYLGKTLEYSVNVVNRVSLAEDYMYFIGEELGDAQPRLKITRDDGSVINVTLPDDAVTVTGFDTSKATDKLTLTVDYDKNGEKFSGTVDISVCSPEIQWDNPRKTVYGNDETELDLTGAMLALESPDGNTIRYVDFSQLTATGFAPEVVNKDNQSANQTITVTYRGRTVATFEITVNYSDVSRFKDTADDLIKLNWDCYSRPTAEDPSMKVPAEATVAMQQDALELLQMYFGFKTAQANSISQNQFEAVARLAVVYGYNTWMQAFEKAYSDVFDISSGGTLTYTAASRDIADAAVQKYNECNDEDTQQIVLLSQLLNNETLSALTQNTKIYTSVEDGEEVGVTVAALASVVKDTVYVQRMFQVLEWSVDAYDFVSVVNSPDTTDGWKDIDLVQYALDMEQAYIRLLEVYQNEAVNETVYPLINSWREKEDLFEVLYRYYFALSESEGTSIDYVIKNLTNLASMMLPVPLETIRQYATNAALAQMAMVYSAQSYQEGEMPILMDSSMFMCYFKDAEKLSDEFLSANNDVVYATLYQMYILDTMTELMMGDYGYLDLTDYSAYDDSVLALWANYNAMWLDYTLANGDFTAEQQTQFDGKVVALFNQFVNLKPIQQRYFLSALNYLDGLGFPAESLFPTEGYLASDFANFIYDYYCRVLDIDVTSEEKDTAYNVFTNLMLAIEWYADGDVQYFCSAMEVAMDEYGAETWVNADKTVFDRELKSVYDKYVAYFHMFNGTPAVDEEGNPVVDEDGEQITNWSYNGTLEQQYVDLFKKAYEAQAKAELAGLYINYGSYNIYTAFLASYEAMTDYVNQILASADSSVTDAYYNMPFGDSTAVADLQPLYNSVYTLEGTFQQLVRLFGFTPDQYLQQTELRDFLKKYEDYFWTSAKLQYTVLPEFNEGTDAWVIFRQFEMTPENVNALTTEFSSLSTTAQSYMITFDMAMAGDTGIALLYNGIVLSVYDVFEATPALNIVSDLITLEVTSLSYKLMAADDNTTESDLAAAKEEVLTLWNTVSTAYDALDEQTATLFDSYFGGMYSIYLNFCSQLNVQ